MTFLQIMIHNKLLLNLFLEKHRDKIDWRIFFFDADKSLAATLSSFFLEVKRQVALPFKIILTSGDNKRILINKRHVTSCLSTFALDLIPIFVNLREIHCHWFLSCSFSKKRSQRNSPWNHRNREKNTLNLWLISKKNQVKVGTFENVAPKKDRNALSRCWEPFFA